jgi:hypothetical protein
VWSFELPAALPCASPSAAKGVWLVLRACGIDRTAQNLPIQAAITTVEMRAGELVWINEVTGWQHGAGGIYVMLGFGGAFSRNGSREGFGRTLRCAEQGLIAHVPLNSTALQNVASKLLI